MESKYNAELKRAGEQSTSKEFSLRKELEDVTAKLKRDHSKELEDVKTKLGIDHKTTTQSVFYPKAREYKVRETIPMTHNNFLSLF